MTRRGALATLVACLALVLQTSALSHLSWHGAYPDLVLVVVVTAGLTCGSQFAMVLGFAAGLLVDLAPPADHVAGRWALALLVVGYVAGRVRPETGFAAAPGVPSVWHALATVAGCSFLGSSVFALTGLVLGDGPGGAGATGDLIGAVLLGVVCDVLVAPFVVPWLARLLVRVEPERALA